MIILVGFDTVVLLVGFDINGMGSDVPLHPDSSSVMQRAASCCAWFTDIAITRLLKRRDKFPACHAQVGTFNCPCFHQAYQDFLTYSWQYSIGQDRIDHAAATFVFRATAHNMVNDLRIIGKGHFVMVIDTFSNPSQLQPDNIGQNGSAERVVGNSDEMPQ
jgi:hypothetical protein